MLDFESQEILQVLRARTHPAVPAGDGKAPCRMDEGFDNGLRPRRRLRWSMRKRAHQSRSVGRVNHAVDMPGEDEGENQKKNERNDSESDVLGLAGADEKSSGNRPKWNQLRQDLDEGRWKWRESEGRANE